MKGATILSAILMMVSLQVLAQETKQNQSVPLRHEFVARGNSAKELKTGTYIIVGVFKTEENAKRVSTSYKEMEVKGTNFGYVSVKNLWYTYLSKHADMESAKESLASYRENKLYKGSWLLTVHEGNGN
jgi:hypothetical protein